MLYELSYYYQKARESGITNLNAKNCYATYDRITGEHKCWPEVRNHYEYIDKCYAIASEVLIENLKEKFFSSSFNEEALNKLRLEVLDEQHALTKKYLIYNGCGYTPIYHMQEQLDDLLNDIFRARDICRILNQKILITPNPVTPQKKSFLSKLFKRKEQK